MITPLNHARILSRIGIRMGSDLLDRLSKDKRSWNMSRIRSRDTVPEMRVRSLLHSLGYRFRLCPKTLPGKPDIVLPKYRSVIFVHGCFWHQHKNCKKASLPKSNTDFWLKKFENTKRRDEMNIRALEQLGWNVIVVWECELNNMDKLKSRLESELERLGDNE